MNKPEQQLNPHEPGTKEFWIWNTESAITMMESVPENNVFLDLFRADEPPRDKRTGRPLYQHKPACGTIACIGGWCALWPPFVALGVSVGPRGNPVLKTSNYNLSTGAHHARFFLFGPESDGLFDGADEEWSDEFTHKEMALNRLRNNLEDLKGNHD